MLRKVVAVLVLLIVAIVALRLAVGLVVGAVHAVLWVAVIVALVVGVLWARRTLTSGPKPKQDLPPEDPVQAEMRRITEQLREQGRR